MKFTKYLALLLTTLLLFTSCGKAAQPTENITTPPVSYEETAASEETSQSEEISQSEETDISEETPQTEAAEQSAEPDTEAQSEMPYDLPEYGGYYYDVENVVLYLDAYGELPPNYITKNEARDLGWEGGSVEDYLEGAAIGGDRFGNYEGILPEADGRAYTECDIDTDGYPSRGSRRLVFSNDGLYFYTSDHYEHFSEVTITADGEVVW